MGVFRKITDATDSFLISAKLRADRAIEKFEKDMDGADTIEIVIAIAIFVGLAIVVYNKFGEAIFGKAEEVTNQINNANTWKPSN